MELNKELYTDIFLGRYHGPLSPKGGYVWQEMGKHTPTHNSMQSMSNSNLLPYKTTRSAYDNKEGGEKLQPGLPYPQLLILPSSITK